MNKQSLSYLALASMLLAPTLSIAQEAEESESNAAEVTQEGVTTINEMAKDAPKLKASNQLKKEMKAWKKKHKVQIGVKKSGAIYLEGTARVSENAASPRFVMARAAAFELAYLDALSGYVMDKSGFTSFNKAYSYMNDGSSDRNTPPKNLEDAVTRIAAKTEKLTEAKLDEALRNAGVPTAEFEKSNIVAKRQLFLERLITDSVDQAVEEASGVYVVATFEGNDDNGQYAIGVILRGGVETETIADCLRTKSRPKLVRPDKACPIEEMLPDEEDIAQEFGVRVIFDEQGVPALISYGQAGCDYTGDDEEEAEDFEKLALEQAEGQANDNLTMFINSSISLKRVRSSGSSRERVLEFDSNGVPTRQSVKKYLNKITKDTKVSGSDTMIGRSTIFKEMVSHPVVKNQQIAVCVRMWSFGQYDAMSAVKNRPRGQDAEEKVPAPSPTVKGGARHGRTYDF